MNLSTVINLIIDESAHHTIKRKNIITAIIYLKDQKRGHSTALDLTTTPLKIFVMGRAGPCPLGVEGEIDLGAPKLEK